MDIHETGPEGLALVHPLWERLNQLHLERSEYFQDHFSKFTFDQRTKELNIRERVRVFYAEDIGNQKYLGYCIASVDQGIGEVDSLYVLPSCQGSGLGQALMERALAWLKDQGCSRIRVAVAQGNEQALGFYEKFGFKPRFTVLEHKD